MDDAGGTVPEQTDPEERTPPNAQLKTKSQESITAGVF